MTFTDRVARYVDSSETCGACAVPTLAVYAYVENTRFDDHTFLSVWRTASYFLPCRTLFTRHHVAKVLSLSERFAKRDKFITHLRSTAKFTFCVVYLLINLNSREGEES